MSNRGVSETERLGTVVDWLAASVDFFAVLEARSAVASFEDRCEVINDLSGLGLCAEELAGHVADHFFPGVFKLGEKRKGNFYAWRVRFEDAQGNHVGMIEFGGPHTARADGTHTARIELTGEGCRIYEASGGNDHAERWSLLASLLGCANARISRIDIAADDFKGEHPVSWAIARYEAGDFDKRGQRPKARLIDDMGNRTGKTFYVGSRKSENQLRVYEKGRERGDPNSEWVRYEGEFHASNRRELPLDMMVNGAAYLVGAYPVLDFVDGIGERLRIETEKVLATCRRAVANLRHQYGPMLNAMLHAAGGDEATLGRLITGTARSVLPGWCTHVDQVEQLLTAIIFAPSGAIKGDKPEQAQRRANHEAAN